MIVVPETISTPRLLLRRPKAADAAAVFEYGGDPEVARFMDWPLLSELQDASRATENAQPRWDSGDEYSWRVTIKPDDTPIGSVSCSIDGHKAEFGFVLARRCWGQGFASEAGRAVLGWLTSLPHVDRVQATCDIENSASARVLEKVGMVRDGVLRRWTRRPNLPGEPIRDAILYAWVREA